MGELGLNKILGAVLATCLGLFALHELSGIVFGGGGGHGHGDDHAENMTMTEKFCAKFAYCIPIAESGAAGAIEEVFDLGLALTNADPAKGAKSFKGKCSTCHTVEAGGASGTGPNLSDIVGGTVAAKAGFGYSGSLTDMGGEWTYESLDSWLKAPSKMVSGTSMSFAGVPRDDERANIIAYLASSTSNPPAFPAPLDTVDAGEGIDGEATEGEGTDGEGAEAPTETDGGATPAPDGDTQDEASVVPAVADDAVEAVAGVVEDAADTVADAAGDATQAVTDAVEDAEDAVEGAMEEPDQAAYDHAEGTDTEDHGTGNEH